MPETYNPSPAEILATAEDERHTLLAHAARQHNERLESEIRRYQADIARIEDTFRLRTSMLPQVPEWITMNRRADITEALNLVTGLPVIAVRELALSAGLDTTKDQLWDLLHESLSEPARVYQAWQVATTILKAAGR